jgi:Uma2 family endonuclease
MSQSFLTIAYASSSRFDQPSWGRPGRTTTDRCEVSWEGYEALLSELGDSLQYRVTFLDGNLELVSPSRRRHERNKRTIGSLIELYCQEKRIRYFPLGSTTFRKEAQRGGTEPDESYCIETDKPFPDLAIEVVVTSGGWDKLEV